ncbi:MAG: ATP-binding protein [Richelia sp. RM1_1_1]|nr:ATP-binding protein [Richelia sp. RM1_1_1]
MQSSFKSLIEIIQDKHPIIACESPLQERYRFLLNTANYCDENNQPCYLWNLNEDELKELKILNGVLIISNFSDYQPKSKHSREDYFQVLNFCKKYEGKGILIVENLFPWIQDADVKETEFFIISEWVKSSLLNIKIYNQNNGKTILMLGSSLRMASDIAAEIPSWYNDLPTVDEIIAELKTQKLLPNNYTNSDYIQVGSAGIGLYLSDIVNGIKEIRKTVDLNDIETVTKLFITYKVNLLNKLYDIEFVQPSKMEVGGLELMQQSFKKFKRMLTPRAKQYNLKVPKGMMLVGPPGTGKSHSAKACSQNMGIPLIAVDWGNFRSFDNQAEAKLTKLLKLADTLNQVIVYFDDFDKGFAGDDDLSKRLAGKLLTWMQERTSDVFVIASVNRMEWLPPELTRAGRFDYIFKIDLPNNFERYTIFKINLAKFDKRFRNGNDPWSQEEWRRILKATNRCVGAEIQTIVERAASTIFCNSITGDEWDEADNPPLELTIEAILEERRQINPLAIREADRVESMRNKADAQGLPSSPVDDSVYTNGNINIFG